jgi:2-methylcitrate dehydratase PrpD
LTVLTLTDRFTADLYTFAQQPFEQAALDEAKRCLIDYYAAVFAGVKMIGGKTSIMLDLMGSVDGRASIIGMNRKADVQQAALINAMHAHVAELDDGQRHAMMHPAVPIISALLPFAEKGSFDGKALLRGIIVGYEAAIRLASCLQPGMKERGYHGTGTAGSVGAAMALVAAHDCSQAEFKAAFSASITSASGILNVIKDVSTLKPYNAANAAVNGVQAFVLASAGFIGPYDVLEGPLGFLNMMSHQVNTAELCIQPNDGLRIFQIYRKPYAACRHSHAAVDAALHIKANYTFAAEDIVSVKVATYKWAVAGHEHTDIVSINSAKMSTPYAVAVALLSGKAGIHEFDADRIQDQELLQLTTKVVIQEDPELTSLAPNKRAASVTVCTKSDEFTYQVDLPKGEPENPISSTELEKELEDLAAYNGISKDKTQLLVERIWQIESRMNELFKLTF